MASKPKTITVKAACHLCEEGTHYAPGAELQVTPERATALGDAVTEAPEAAPQ